MEQSTGELLRLNIEHLGAVPTFDFTVSGFQWSHGFCRPTMHPNIQVGPLSQAIRALAKI